MHDINIFFTDGAQYKKNSQPFGRTHAIAILLLISLFLMVREIFSVATVSDSRKQNTEHFWYPLLAVPEIIAVVLYSAPGLVPTRHELDLSQGQSANWGEQVALQTQPQQLRQPQQHQYQHQHQQHQHQQQKFANV